MLQVGWHSNFSCTAANLLSEPSLSPLRKGGPLAVTDANLLLGRLIPDYFPKIFGKSEKEGLDIEASKHAFEKVAAEVNANFDKKLSLDEIVYGYVHQASVSVFLLY